MNLEEIRHLIGEGKYEFSFHAQLERLEENLDVTEIEEAVVSHAEILQEYPDDPRGESCLVLAFFWNPSDPSCPGMGTRRKQGDEKVLRVITVYRPRLPKWTDPRTRR
ncbi:MAG: DUF4258 domain-containing protein [Acidobacteria bacterium]|nr:DUF4258 domain-containing protein [Acidobacteriota bacterium]